MFDKEVNSESKPGGWVEDYKEPLLDVLGDFKSDYDRINFDTRSTYKKDFNMLALRKILAVFRWGKSTGVRYRTDRLREVQTDIEQIMVYVKWVVDFLWRFSLITLVHISGGNYHGHVLFAGSTLGLVLHGRLWGYDIILGQNILYCSGSFKLICVKLGMHVSVRLLVHCVRSSYITH